MSVSRNDQRSDTRGLIDDKEGLPMLPKSVGQRSQLGSVIRQAAVEQSSTGAVQRHGVVSTLSDVDADEDFNAWLVGGIRG